jgi:hypothetical protein
MFVTGCSAAADSTAADGEAAWTYVSGDGETYTAPEVPTRIIAEANAAKSLMEFGIEPVGIWASSPVGEDVGLRGADFSSANCASRGRPLQSSSDLRSAWPARSSNASSAIPSRRASSASRRGRAP